MIRKFPKPNIYLYMETSVQADSQKQTSLMKQVKQERMFRKNKHAKEWSYSQEEVFDYIDGSC